MKPQISVKKKTSGCCIPRIFKLPSRKRNKNSNINDIYTFSVFVCLGKIKKTISAQKAPGKNACKILNVVKITHINLDGCSGKFE